MAEPAYWIPVIEEIQYLKPKAWLGNNSIDRYLLQHWAQVKDQSPVLYLNTYHIILCASHLPPSSEECRTVRRQLLLPEGGMIPMQPVAFIIYNDETKHYFTVVMNHNGLHITTYGRLSIDKMGYAPEPNKWAGPHIWRNICKIFNWEIPVQQPVWWALDWKQVSLSFDKDYIKSDVSFRMGLTVVHLL
jgi:hypothetical protein